MDQKDGYIVLAKGYNGATSFSLLTKEKRKSIIDFSDPGSFCLKFVEDYPDIAEQVLRYHQCDNDSDLPKDLDISHLEPSSRLVFVNAVSGLVKSKKEKMKVV